MKNSDTFKPKLIGKKLLTQRLLNNVYSYLLAEKNITKKDLLKKKTPLKTFNEAYLHLYGKEPTGFLLHHIEKSLLLSHR